MNGKLTREDFDTALKMRNMGRFVYPFFAVHMAFFGGFGFFLAYFHQAPDLKFLYLQGGFAIFVYLTFYVTIFGRDEIRWMFTNAALGLFGIYAMLDGFLGLFGKFASDYSWKVHLIPAMYYVLYTFLLRQFILDITRTRDQPARRVWVERGYVAISVLVYALLWWLGPESHTSAALNP